MHMNLKPNKHRIISFNTTIMASLGFIIVVTSPPPFLLKGGGGGMVVQNFLLERGDEIGGGVPIFYCFTVQSYLLCVRGK